MRITAAGLTDVGLQRDHNEDTFRCVDQHGLYLVADGMGGHRSGEVASKMAADGVLSFFDATAREDATWPFPPDPVLGARENRLAAAIKMANKQIFDRSVSDVSAHGMGTTVVGMLISVEDGSAIIGHVGDSRAYRVRDERIMQLTRDHSLVNDYMAMMPDLPKEAMDVLPKNVITRALGMQDTVAVDLVKKDVQEGDRFILCTDGLSGQVPGKRICEIVIECGKDVQACAKKLIAAANEAGGDDNVTVVVVAVDAE